MPPSHYLVTALPKSNYCPDFYHHCFLGVSFCFACFRTLNWVIPYAPIVFLAFRLNGIFMRLIHVTVYRCSLFIMFAMKYSTVWMRLNLSLLLLMVSWINVLWIFLYMSFGEYSCTFLLDVSRSRIGGSLVTHLFRFSSYCHTVFKIVIIVYISSCTSSSTFGICLFILVNVHHLKINFKIRYNRRT